MYKEVLENNCVEQTSEFTLKILTYEVGKIHQIDVYSERFGDIGYKGDRKVEVGDILTMISLYIEQLGYDLEEIKREGLERLKDRIKEVRKVQLEKEYGDGKNR